MEQLEVEWEESWVVDEGATRSAYRYRGVVQGYVVTNENQVRAVVRIYGFMRADESEPNWQRPERNYLGVADVDLLEVMRILG